MPKWKPGIFGPGPRVPMDRERRAVFRAKLLLQRTPGRLTIATASIGRVLVDMLGADGKLTPSLATIAEKARVSVATVKRALVQLRSCGFVAWTRRLVRDAASGWRTEQASNAYVLVVPSCEAHFAPVVRRKGFVPSNRSRAATDLTRQEALKALAVIAARRMQALGLAG